MEKDNSQRVPTTICSAILYQGNKIALKETEAGLSLLGGHVEWNMGFPYCLERRIGQENMIAASFNYINGITHHKTPSGKDVVNVNVVGDVIDTSKERGIIWMTLEEALKRETEFRTPDVYRLLQRTKRLDNTDLAFVQTTMKHRTDIDNLEIKSQTNTEVSGNDDPFSPTDFIVVSGALRYFDLKTGRVEYGLMRCERPQFKGLLSLVGGKLERGETIGQGITRETMQETGNSIDLHPIGLVGLYVNQIPGIGDYISNIAALIEAKSKDIVLPDSLQDEVKEVIWKTPGEISSMPGEEFRSRDTRRIIMRAESLARQGRILPFGLIEEIQ